MYKNSFFSFSFFGVPRFELGLSSTFFHSGNWESNPDRMLPKHAYYRYTIPRSKVLDMLPLHHTTLYKDLLGQEVCILPLYDSPIKGARYAIVVSRRQLAVLIGWLHHFPLHFG